MIQSCCCSAGLSQVKHLAPRPLCFCPSLRPLVSSFSCFDKDALKSLIVLCRRFWFFSAELLCASLILLCLTSGALHPVTSWIISHQTLEVTCPSLATPPTCFSFYLFALRLKQSPINLNRRWMLFSELDPSPSSPVFAAEPRQEYRGSQPCAGVVSLLEKCPVHLRRPVPLHRQQLHRPGQPASVPGGPL